MNQERNQTQSLIQALKQIKAYALPSNGDFSKELLVALSPILSLPADKVLKYELLEKLEQCLQKSKINNQDKVRFYVNLIEPKERIRTGYSLFSLDYALDPPLNKQIDTLSYHDISNLLWYVRGLEVKCVQCWEELRVKGKNKYNAEQHNFLHQITNFIKQLFTYFMGTVIDNEFEILIDSIQENPKNFSNIHSEFQQTIRNRLFLNEKSLIIKYCLYDIFEVIENQLASWDILLLNNFNGISYILLLKDKLDLLKQTLKEQNKFIPFLSDEIKGEDELEEPLSDEYF